MVSPFCPKTYWTLALVRFPARTRTLSSVWAAFWNLWKLLWCVCTFSQSCCCSASSPCTWSIQANHSLPFLQAFWSRFQCARSVSPNSLPIYLVMLHDQGSILVSVIRIATSASGTRALNINCSFLFIFQAQISCTLLLYQTSVPLQAEWL